MPVEYKHSNGETYMLEDSDECAIKISYKDVSGTLTIAPNRFPRPYNISFQAVGVGTNRYSYPTRERAIGAICDNLLTLQRDFESRQSFDAETACKDSHQFVEDVRTEK